MLAGLAGRSSGSIVTRLALISDIHANLPALEAVLADIAKRDVFATYHLGDLVGYAPWADQVVALIRDRHIAGVSGNYDSTIATDLSTLKDGLLSAAMCLAARTSAETRTFQPIPS